VRTTIDLEAPVLEELKRVQQEEGVSLGKLASRLLADALDFRRKKTAKP
jgi:predicted DNA-binding ribbon-helix-helix protein